MSKTICWMAASLGVLGSAVVALGDPTRHVSPAAIDLGGGWVLNTIIDTEPGKNDAVNSFVAINNSPTAYGGNLMVVRYAADLPGSCTTWKGETFLTTDVWSAIKTIKFETGVSDTEDDLWATTAVRGTEVEAATKLGYKSGLIEGDPLYEVVEGSGDRDEFLATLVEWGYLAAKIPLESFDPDHTSGEKVDAELNALSPVALAAAVPNAQTMPPATTPPPAWPVWPVLPTVLPGTPGTLPCAPPCIPMTYTVRLAWGTWSCGTGWTPGVFTNPYCVYTKECCHYREVWSATLTATCVLSYTFLGFESQCWTHTVNCSTNGPGNANCPTAPLPPCDVTLTPVPSPPGPTTPLHPHI